jgi:hypothetical protein
LDTTRLRITVPRVRLTCEPLTADLVDDRLPVQGANGVACELWSRRLEWPCRDRLLRVQIIAAEPIALPAAEPSEPVAGAIARLNQALRGSGGLPVLVNPAEAFGAERIALAEGMRLFAIASAEDEACWDAMLTLGQPVYGLRATVACDCRTTHPGAVISALAYGNFTCEEGLSLARLDETPQGVAYATAGDSEAAVIIRGGFEAARLAGHAGSWRDRGNEAYVRLVVRDGQGTCWTQPRFVAARGPAPTAAHGP